MHTHLVPERATIITGTWHLAPGTRHFAIGKTFDSARTELYRPGDTFIVSTGMAMEAFTTEETVLKLHGTGPWGISYIHPPVDL